MSIMHCTEQEIAKKRRLAQEKLARKLATSPLRNLTSPITNQSKDNLQNFEQLISPNRVIKKFNFKHTNKPYEKTTPTKVQQFYGKDKVITGKSSLINEERFTIILTSFSSAAIDLFKTIPSKNYNPTTRNWDFHINDHDNIIQKLQSLHPNVIIEKLPTFIINSIKKPKRDLLEIDLSSIEPELLNSLMPFQLEGVRFGIDKNGRCLIADDMGLGKTFQALGIASYYQKSWPLLIVTTASMKNTWEETIHKYLPSVPLFHIQYMTNSKDYIGDCKILIISHDLMTRNVEKLLEKNFGVLIIDESHNFKNFKAKCTKVAIELSKHIKHVILLSGTPVLSRPNELYQQLAIINEKFFGSFFEFSKRYCDGKTTSFGWDSSGKSNLQELEILLNRHFMIRRTKEQVLKALPNKIQQVITLNTNLNEFSDKDRKCLNALAERFKSEKKGTEKHAALLTFFAETAKIKIPSVCSYILQILETKQKFLVFAHHQKMLNAIEKILKQKDIKFIRIDGNTNSEQRKYFVDKFQFNDNYLCALLSITAANAGITLTAAQLVLFAELHWNPSILSQAESRAHRIGQMQSVIVRYLIAPGTADDSIWPMLQEKQKILSEIGLNKDSFNDISMVKQEINKNNQLIDDWNSEFTIANTLDISSYFKNENSSFNEDCFNDGFDDVLSNINM